MEISKLKAESGREKIEYDLSRKNGLSKALGKNSKKAWSLVFCVTEVSHTQESDLEGPAKPCSGV